MYESEEPEELKVDNDCELVWAKIKVTGSKDLYVESFYRPPSITDPEYLSTLESYLSRIPTHNGAHLWLGGDFNLPGIDWPNETVKTKATNRSECSQLLEISKNLLLDQIVLDPTRITETQANTLDLFFTNNETLVNQARIIPGISDHETVFIESSQRPMMKKITPHKVWQYRKANYEQLKEELHQYQEKFNNLESPSTMIYG